MIINNCWIVCVFRRGESYPPSGQVNRHSDDYIELLQLPDGSGELFRYDGIVVRKFSKIV